MSGGLEALAFAAIGGGTFLEVLGYDQAARAEQIKQQEIARQARDNALAIKAQAERDSTIRSQRYSEFLRDSSAIRGYNRRGSDRSLRAIQKKAQRQTSEELRQANTVCLHVVDKSNVLGLLLWKVNLQEILRFFNRFLQ